MPLFAFPVVLGGMVLIVMLLYIQAWQRPGVQPMVTAEPAKRAGNFLQRAWHWSTTNLYNYAGPGLVGKVVHGPLASLVKYIEHWTKAALSHQIVALLRPVTGWLHEMEITAREQALELGHFAQLTHNALYYLRHTTIPALIRAAVAPVRLIALEARTLALDVQGRLDTARAALLGALAATGVGAWTTLAQGLAGLVHYVDRLHDQVWTNITPKVEYLTSTLVPQLTRELGRISDDLYTTGVDSLEGLRTRVRVLEREFGLAIGGLQDTVLALLGSVAAIGIIAKALESVWPDLFCNNTRNVTKRLCGLDENLLTQLLAGTLGLLVVLDPKLVAREAQQAVGALDGIIREMANV